MPSRPDRPQPPVPATTSPTATSPGSPTPDAHREAIDPEVARRRDVVMAGHHGDSTTAWTARSDPAPPVRAAALGALDRLGFLDLASLVSALADRSPLVRRRACELCANREGAGAVPLLAMLGDDDVTVVEAACFALGELGQLAGPDAAPALAAVVVDHDDVICREAAVAALGAIGDPAGLPAVLSATGDKPAVRRRAVLALAPFEGPEVDEALTRAASDRDWQVRQAAEDLGVEPTTP